MHFFKPLGAINCLSELRTPTLCLCYSRHSQGPDAGGRRPTPSGTGSTLTHPGERTPGREEHMPGRRTCPHTLRPQQLWRFTFASGSKLFRKNCLVSFAQSSESSWGRWVAALLPLTSYTSSPHPSGDFWHTWGKCPKELTQGQTHKNWKEMPNSDSVCPSEP